MKRVTSARIGAALATIGLLAASGAAADGDMRPLSPAQIALFETGHLDGIGAAERIEYRFEREASDAGGSWRDRVDVDVRPRQDGAKDVWTDFLSGERHMPFPPLAGFHGNPVIMYFLEHDVVEMNRETGGAATYFRNRIRQSFVDRAELRPVAVDRDGKTLDATEITLVPFKDDARILGFPGLAAKRYRFVLSDAVPGKVLEIAVEAPGGNERPSVSERMVFDAVEPCSGDSGPCGAVRQ